MADAGRPFSRRQSSEPCSFFSRSSGSEESLELQETNSHTLKSTIREGDLIYHERLGFGASGEVCRVTWKSKKLGRVEAAAKSILINSDKNIEEQLGNEIHFLQSLSHENIIKHFGQVVTTTYVIIVTELASKGSLHEYLKDKSCLPEGLKTIWAVQLARAIQYLRQKKILHRDVKAQNCLITADNTLKLCDFGISKDLTSTKSTKSERGTVQWLPPEVFTDLKLSPTADIFAFGVMLWVLETCEEPYKGMRSEYVMFQVGAKDLRPEIPQSCPPVFKDLMQRCWDKDRRKRPAIKEVIERLECYESSLQWHCLHEIEANVKECHWVSDEHLAFCEVGHVDVYHVTSDRVRLAYKLTSFDWKQLVKGVAVSSSIPNCILVICEDQPYVYQYPCHQATVWVKKYKIESHQGNHPRCIVANHDTAVIGLAHRPILLICSLPDFSHQRRLYTHVDSILDVSISTDYLLVMGLREILIKPLGDLNQDLCKVHAPDKWGFRSVSFRDNARQIYAACGQGVPKGCVYKYQWDGIGKPQYDNIGCVIDGLGLVNSLSMTVGGVLAVGEPLSGKVRVYSLNK